MLFLSVTVPLFAQEATTTASTTAPTATDSAGGIAGATQKPESDLVKAAHEAKAKKQASTKKPITNADLKKAKSKLITHEPAPVATDTTASAAVTDTRGPIAKDEEHYRDRKAAEERVKTLSAKVSELEKDLDRIEQSYYNENDPNERDTVIFKRFGQTKKQLEDARKELADARDGLDSVNKRP
jgi:hypothetical protein